MVRVGRFGDDEEAINELVNRAKARNRFAEAFVSYPGQEFWVSLIRRILLTKVYAGRGGALLRTRPGAIFAQAFKGAEQVEVAAPEELALLNPEDFIRGAEPEEPAAIFPLRPATIELMATSKISLRDEIADIIIIPHELQVAVMDGMRLRSFSHQFDAEVTDRIAIRDTAVVAVEDNSLLVSVQDGLRLTDNSTAILTLIVNQSTGIPFATVGYLLNTVPDLEVNRSEFLRVAAAATARADLQVAVTDSPGLRVRSATTPTVRITLAAAVESRLRAAAAASVRPVIYVTGESRLAVSESMVGPKVTLLLSVQDTIRAISSIEYIDVVDQPTLEVVASESGLRLAATSLQEAGTRPDISGSASSGLRASAAFGGAARTAPLVQVPASSGVRMADATAQALGARPNISIIESDGVRTPSAFPTVVTGPYPTLDVPTVQDALRVTAAAPALQLSPRSTLVVSETEALRVASARTVTAGARPTLLVSEQEGIRVRSQDPTAASGLRPTLSRSVSTALRARSRAPDDRTVVLGAGPWFPTNGECETLSGWLAYEATSLVALAGGGVSGNCLQCTPTSGLTYSVAYRRVTIPTTGTWRLSWYGKRGVPNSIYVAYMLKPDDGWPTANILSFSTYYTANFVKYSTTAATDVFFTSGEVITVGAGAYGGNNGSPSCYIDNVQLVMV